MGSYPKNMNMFTFPKANFFIRFNLVLISFVLIIYVTILLRYPLASDHLSVIVRCYSVDCLHKVQLTGYTNYTKLTNQRPQQNVPSFLNDMERGMTIGIVNMDEEDLTEWSVVGESIFPISFEKVLNDLKWNDLFPTWIDEEKEKGLRRLCPNIPMPDVNKYGKMDMVVVKIPCNYPEEWWQRDVFRLQLHLVAANMVVMRGRGKTKVVVQSKCRPMVEIFRCDDLVKEEGDQWWFYEPDMKRLIQKVSLPFGTCELALSLGDKGIGKEYDATKLRATNTNMNPTRQEAYATVLHSSNAYVCGAITLAQSLLKTGTNRDLVILIDATISVPNRHALAASGWTIHIIKRIRNPRGTNKTRNEYNYTKLRLWQLTNYHKIIFIDSDIIVLRNLDRLFSFPQMSAAGNARFIFNSGVMVIEPSDCTYKQFMQRINEIVSYNGGDQGFLNDMFVYWHRLPKTINYLKYFSLNATRKINVRNQLVANDPPKIYAMHFLGLKPWLCYRDYDCNWDSRVYRVFASDVAHRRWWKIYDAMDEMLRKQCELTETSKIKLKQNREIAKRAMFPDGHWRINVTDPRSFD